MQRARARLGGTDNKEVRLPSNRHIYQNSHLVWARRNIGRHPSCSDYDNSWSAGPDIQGSWRLARELAYSRQQLKLGGRGRFADRVACRAHRACFPCAPLFRGDRVAHAACVARAAMVGRIFVEPIPSARGKTASFLYDRLRGHRHCSHRARGALWAARGRLEPIRGSGDVGGPGNGLCCALHAGADLGPGQTWQQATPEPPGTTEAMARKSEEILSSHGRGVRRFCRRLVLGRKEIRPHVSLPGL